MFFVCFFDSKVEGLFCSNDVFVAVLFCLRASYDDASNEAIVKRRTFVPPKENRPLPPPRILAPRPLRHNRLYDPRSHYELPSRNKIK